MEASKEGEEVTQSRGLTNAGAGEGSSVGEVGAGSGAGTGGVGAALSFESLPTATTKPIPIPTPSMRSNIKQHMTIAKHVMTFRSCVASIDDHRMDHNLLLSSAHDSSSKVSFPDLSSGVNSAAIFRAFPPARSCSFCPLSDV
jgi:hypothetical protein